MYRKQTVAPVNPAIELADVKLYGYINTDEDDSFITSLLDTAVAYVEDYTGKALINQTFDVYYSSNELRDKMPLCELNVTAINSFNTYDLQGNATLMSSSLYRLTGNKEVSVVFDQGITYSTVRDCDAAIVNVSAGYGASKTDIPDKLFQATAMFCAHLYRYNGVVSDDMLKNMPWQIHTHLTQYTSVYSWVG